MVLILPIEETPTTARLPSSAIHSRNADTVISRPIMIIPGIANHGEPSLPISRIKVIATISLSATGSRKAPKGDSTFIRRAKKPSNQSVQAAVQNIARVIQRAATPSIKKKMTKSGISRILKKVMMLGMFHIQVPVLLSFSTLDVIYCTLRNHKNIANCVNNRRFSAL